MLVVRPGRGIFRVAFLSLLALLTIGLAVPALASAATFTVNSTGDEAQKTPGAAGCETAAGKCTLRAAIEAANVGGVKDRIAFDEAVFDGTAGSTIEPAPGSPLPEVKVGEPVTIDGGVCGGAPCATLQAPTGYAGLTVRADGSVVEHLRVLIDGSVGIMVVGTGANQPGVEILDNVITVTSTTVTTSTGISLAGPIGGSGNLVEGNTIKSPPENYVWGISLRNGPNRIFGNVIEGGGCCYQGILAQSVGDPVNGNQIGGDTTASENVITGFSYSAIWLNLGESTRNEVGRNRGDNGDSFIRFGSGTNGGIQPPTIVSALQSSVSGTAQPGAKVRLFRKAYEYGGDLEGFLGEAVADDSGNWKVTVAKVPVGTYVAATQTSEGGTSQVTGAVKAAAGPPPPTCATDPGLCPPPPPPSPPPPDTTKPKVTIKKAPKAKSTATTAKFVFSADESGSKFKCKLDSKAFADCKSPRTYKKLKPGKHAFKVKATDAAGNTSAVVTRKFTVLE
jgi:CSLREA domain-containing protein